jgi:ketosteroid isomerase-like protein
MEAPARSGAEPVRTPDRQEKPTDNVAIVKRAFEAFARRDIRAALELADPDIELFAPGTAAFARGGRSYRGHQGLVRYFRDVARVWDELEVVPQRFRQKDDYVVVIGRLRARREGAFLVDEPAQWVWQLRDAKILVARAFTDRDDALAAAGLDE